MNALQLFELTSICQGHESMQPSAFRSYPHIVLRFRAHVVSEAIQWIQKGASGEFPLPEHLPLASAGAWSIEHERSLK
ncbi:MAG: hypothetical protein ACKOAH_29380, partial [Pirellula sp.]